MYKCTTIKIAPLPFQGVDALWERMERMVAHGPVFCDITWGAGGSTANATLDIATKMQHLVRFCVSVGQTSVHTAVAMLTDAFFLPWHAGEH